jgi:hypothetical protein
MHLPVETVNDLASPSRMTRLTTVEFDGVDGICSSFVPMTLARLCQYSKYGQFGDSQDNSVRFRL